MKKNELFNIGKASEDDEFVIGTQDTKASMSIKKRLMIGIAAAAVVLALALVLPSLLEAAAPPAQDQSSAISDSPLSSALSAADSNLTINVYDTENKESALESNVSIEYRAYSILLSSVPGMPFIITINDEDLEPDSIRVDVDAGSILSWTPPDYSSKKRGKTYVLSTGDTIYWSPFDQQSTPVDHCEMTVTVYDKSNQAYTMSVTISQTSDDFGYTAELKK